MRLRPARAEDFPAIIGIVNSRNNRKSFGWVMKAVLAASPHAAPEGDARNLFLVAEERKRVVAFLRAYHRRDGVTTLHEIGVAEDRQGAGVGSALLKRLLDVATRRGQAAVRLKTPVDLRSNLWYPRFGFVRTGHEAGRKRPLNVYERRCAREAEKDVTSGTRRRRRDAGREARTAAR